MKFGSVCSGIEAASVAWHPLGWRAAWLAEIEPFPSAVLAHHYPEVPNLGDMTQLPELVALGHVEAPDVFCGGTPCQAFSVAGLRKSLDDARGNLSLTFCEIANAIDLSRAHDNLDPCIVFWENVPGVLNTKDNAFGCFLAGLAGEDDPLVAPGGKWSNAGAVLGPQRAVAWRVLDAQYFGVAQRRRRVFVVASARNGFDPAAVLFEFDGVRRDTAPSREAREGIAGSVTASSGRRGGVNEPDSGHLRPVKQWPAEVSSTLDTTFGTKQGLEDQHVNAGCPLFVPVAFDTTQLTSPANRSSPQPGDACHPLAAGAHAPAIAFPANLSGTQCASTENLSPAIGAINPTAVAFQSSQSGVRLAETHATLDANNGPRRHNGVLAAMQVRRLTPVECERLQGFPDGYTDIPWTEYQRVQKVAAKSGASFEAELKKRGKVLRGPDTPACPDGPRYKALGNSWAVPVVAWIGARIQSEVFGGLA